MESEKNFPLLTLQNITLHWLIFIIYAIKFSTREGHLNLVEHVDGVRKLDLFFLLYFVEHLPEQPNATLTRQKKTYWVKKMDKE